MIIMFCIKQRIYIIKFSYKPKSSFFFFTQKTL